MIQFSAILDGVSKKKDNTLSLKLGTQELEVQDTAKIFELGNKQIWVAFAETQLTKDDLNIPEVLGEFRTDKTPSQRLRSILYIFWEQNKKGTTDWESYYRIEIEKIIEYIKDKLE